MQLKSSESGPVVPSTSMAAHAVDTEIDIELDEKIENVENASRRDEEEPAYESERFPLPLPPPPPFPPKNFSRVSTFHSMCIPADHYIVFRCLYKKFLLMPLFFFNIILLLNSDIVLVIYHYDMRTSSTYYYGYYSSKILFSF